MPDPWNKVLSSKDEPKLLDIISEELCNRLHIGDDFVWVDKPEEQPVKETPVESVRDFETINILQLNNTTITKVAQYTSDNETAPLEALEEDTDVLVSDLELLEPDAWKEFKYTKKKSINFLKTRYPISQWIKRLEHGTAKINSKKQKVSDEKDADYYYKKNCNALLEKFIRDRNFDVIGTGNNSFVCHTEVVGYYYKADYAVKVYKISNNKEKNKIVFKRVQREFEHLSIIEAHRSKVGGCYLSLAPRPIISRENVIVMAFIGNNRNVLCPSIEDLPFDNDNGIYIKIVDFIDKCYNEMHLVHGKLSPKKILYWNENPWFVGWSHSVKTDHPQAMSKLIRDCHFVTEFYKKRGVAVKTTEELFKEITGFSKISDKLLEIIGKRTLYEIYDGNPNHRNIEVNGKSRFK